jgi:hypothetical protein
MAKLVNVPSDTLWVHCESEAEWQTWVDGLPTRPAQLSDVSAPVRFLLVQGRVIGTMVGGLQGAANVGICPFCKTGTLQLCIGGSKANQIICKKCGHPWKPVPPESDDSASKKEAPS